MKIEKNNNTELHSSLDEVILGEKSLANGSRQMNFEEKYHNCNHRENDEKSLNKPKGQATTTTTTTTTITQNRQQPYTSRNIREAKEISRYQFSNKT